ncbi:MAG: TIGR00730 family Rossman fold protein [Planctomycetaceae bacterium]|nr:TIGR00730 family Rossman fold protein [Planctomycetaceae bacterium]
MSSDSPRAIPDDSEDSVFLDVAESFAPVREPEVFEHQRLIDEIKDTADKLVRDQAKLGDLKILSRALKELRYSFKIFTPMRRNRKVTVFGSARTPPEDPNYQMAVEYGRRMAEEGWYVVTGAGPGIMEAANVGAGPEASIGLNILLPFEQQANYILDGDPKLINLKYFFTRKLLFVKEVHAIAMFPGGFGTLDECLETLTLVQTGKRDLMPISLISVAEEDYWDHFHQYVIDQLLAPGLISEEDTSLYRINKTVDEAVNEIMSFYSVYHSMRYVRGRLVLRLHRDPSPEFMDRLNDQFSSLCTTGRIDKTCADEVEQDEEHLLHLPRICLQFNRRDMGRLRQMVDVINRELSVPAE